MSSKDKNTQSGIAEKLFFSPWWLSMSLAFFFLYLFRAILPFTLKEQVIFSGVASQSKILGTWVFLFFFAISICSAIRELVEALKSKAIGITKHADKPNDPPHGNSMPASNVEADASSQVDIDLSSRKEEDDIEIIICDASSSELPYVKKNYLTTKTERDFLKVLEQAIDGRADIFPNVRLWDILKVSSFDRKDKTIHENKIRAKHIDFTLCEKETHKIIGCIELDDKTHSSQQAIKNDSLKDEAFESAGLPLIRIRCENYTLEGVKNSIDKLWEK